MALTDELTYHDLKGELTLRIGCILPGGLRLTNPEELSQQEEHDHEECKGNIRKVLAPLNRGIEPDDTEQDA